MKDKDFLKLLRFESRILNTFGGDLSNKKHAKIRKELSLRLSTIVDDIEEIFEIDCNKPGYFETFHNGINILDKNKMSDEMILDLLKELRETDGGMLIIS